MALIPQPLRDSTRMPASTASTRKILRTNDIVAPVGIEVQIAVNDNSGRRHWRGGSLLIWGQNALFKSSGTAAKEPDMAGNKRIVLLVHGWSVRNTDTYGGLRERLKLETQRSPELQLDVRQIWL